MRARLDRALAEIAGPMTGLRAVVLSAAPDGLLAWSWSHDDKHERALGFAALDRAVTICLEALGASERGRNLLLSAEDTWVVAWPLHDLGSGEHRRERLVITVVFAGELQTGLVMMYGARIRMQIRAAVDRFTTAEYEQYSTTLVERVLMREDAARALRDLAAAASIELRRIGRPELLSAAERRRICELAEERFTT